MSAKSELSHGLALLTAFIALHQIITAIRGLQVPPELTLPPLFDPIGGSAWAILFAWITIDLLRLRARRRAGWMLLGFVTYSLLRLFLFARADYDQQRFPFLLVLTALILLGWVILRRIMNGDYTE